MLWRTWRERTTNRRFIRGMRADISSLVKNAGSRGDAAGGVSCAALLRLRRQREGAAVTTNCTLRWPLALAVGPSIATAGCRAMAEPKPATLRPPRLRVPGDIGDPFAVWLRVCLRRVHDAVAAEPVPEALRRLACGEDAEPPSVNSAPGAGTRKEATGDASVNSSEGHRTPDRTAACG